MKQIHKTEKNIMKDEVTSGTKRPYKLQGSIQ